MKIERKPIIPQQITIFLPCISDIFPQNTLVKNLSFGEKRKLEISRLVIEKKRLWIFDEPYLGLDELTIEIFNQTIKNHINTEGMVIFSSHYRLEMRGMDTIDLEKYAKN